MSLQVWLPLTGHLNNQGLLELPSPVLNHITYTNDGKLGQCGNNGCGYHFDNEILGNQWSIALWYNRLAAFASGHTVIVAKNISSTSNCHFYFSIAANGTKLNIGINGAHAGIQYSYNFSTDTWYHLAVTYDGTNVKMYLNGSLVKTGTVTREVQQDALNIGIGTRATAASGTSWNATASSKYNDVRIYNSVISEKEVKELSKGLILHYPLSVGFGGAENLFRDSAMGQHAIDNMVDPFSTDWTKYFRYYNGTTDNHSFSDGIDTITLNGTGNIGICFCRKATDIALDSSSYYTISCEAKCEISGAHLDIGLSYYNTSNSWVWRGGTNPQNFIAVDTWQKFTLTFKPDADTQYIMYCFTIKNTAGKHFSIRHCKLEKGEKATPYTLNMLDTEMADVTTTEYDVSGYNYHGAKNGTITYSSDSARYAVCSNFNGTNSYIEAEPLPASTTTISVWLKTTWDKPPGGSNIYKLALIDSTNKLAIGFSSNAYGLYVYTSDSSSDKGSSVDTTNLYQANKWNHIVIIKTGDKTRTVYINGQLAPALADSRWGSSMNKLLIGCRYLSGNYSSYFDGQISDLRVYATALTEADVKELYNTAASLCDNHTLLAYEYVET